MMTKDEFLSLRHGKDRGRMLPYLCIKEFHFHKYAFIPGHSYAFRVNQVRFELVFDNSMAYDIPLDVFNEHFKNRDKLFNEKLDSLLND